MNFLLIASSTLLLAALQARLPTAWWLGGIRLELLPALVAFGVLTFRHRRWAVTLAVVAGFVQDALSAGPFGNTAAVYALATLLLGQMARAFDREQPAMQMFAGAFVSFAASLSACMATGFTGVAWKILLLAAISAVITPVLFFALDFLRWRTRTA